MIKVECPSCTAPYELDERRLPPSGLNMRCPKCGTSFPVKPPGSESMAPPPPRAPAPPAPPAGGKERHKSTMMGVGLSDLPAPVGAKKPLAPAFPGPAAPAPPSAPEIADLPAPVGAAPAADDFGLDLPAPVGAAPAADDFGLDLPAPKGAAPAADDFGLDLPAPKGAAPAADDFGLDLPAPKGGGAAADLDLDLPAPAGAGADLPAPRRSMGATPFDAWESEAGGADLPAPAAHPDLDLPIPKAAGGFGDELDLPIPKAAGGFGDELDLPVPRGQSDLPQPSVKPQDAGLDLDLDFGESEGGADDFELGGFEPSGGAPADSSDFGDLEIPSLPPPSPGGGGLDLREDAIDMDDELSLPDPVERGGGELDLDVDDGSAGAGGMGFGELDLGGGDEEGGLEFDEIPEETEGAAATPQRVSRVSGPSGEAPAAPAKKGQKVLKTMLTLAAILVVIVGAGVGLRYTNYGIFGIYFMEQFLPGNGEPAHVDRVIAAAEEQARSDTYGDVRASIGALGRERRGAGLNRKLLARSLLHESLYQYRFGEDAASQGRARAIRGRLEERSDDAPGVDVALAAYALMKGEASQANRSITAALRGSPTDPYVHLVAGELALSRGDHEEAAADFAKALELGLGARAQWGVARSAQAAGDREAAAAAADATLELSPGHVSARAARARQLWASEQGEEAVAMARQAAGLDPVGEARIRGSAIDRAAAFTFLGEMYEQLGRRAIATEMYDQAIDLNPFDLRALLGSGRGLLAEHRPADALTRFEAVVEAVETAEPRELLVAEGERALDVQAKFGAVEALLAVDRPQDARAMLNELLSEHADDMMVHLWLGRTAQALDDDATAIELFGKVIELEPSSFAGYNALAQLYFGADRLDDAAAILEQANENVEVNAEVLRLRGQSELRRGRLSQAVERFEAAIEMDGNDTAARFGLGVALRRAGRLPEAQAALDGLSEHDPAYPGLSLERGRIFEAQGQAARAVSEYERALEQEPEDLDLMLRLGGAQVAAGDIDAAERTLREVIRRRPDSAEAEYFMGRVSFARDQLGEALSHFTRAVQLDSSRPEFHVYLAWVSLERNDLGQAQSELRAALEQDDGLADAYLLRARLGVRTGAVRDALRDLERVLQLNPGRADALASRGDAYEQLGERREAIRAYRSAVQVETTNGRFWFRLAQLQYDDGRRREAAVSIDRATSLGAALEPPPRWLIEAYRLGGEVHQIGGERSAAIRDFQRYLELGGPDATDRPAVVRALRRMGIEIPRD